MVSTINVTNLFGLVLSVVNSDNFVAHATASSKSTKMPRADWEVLVNYSVVIPTKNLLKRFNDLFCNVVSLIQNLVNSNRILQEMRDFLLPKLVSGEIDVSSLDVGVPASITHEEFK